LEIESLNLDLGGFKGLIGKFSKVENVEVSDTTKFNSSTKAKYKKLSE